MRNTLQYTFPIILLLSLLSCTDAKQKRDAEILLFAEAKMSEMTKQLGEFDSKIKAAGNNAGIKLELERDKELLKSRIQRFKYHFKM